MDRDEHVTVALNTENTPLIQHVTSQSCATTALWILWYFGDDPCNNLDAVGTVLFEAKASQFDSVRFEIKGNLYSDITVKEADSPTDKAIRMNIRVRASSETALNEVLAKTTSQLNAGYLEAMMDVSEIEMLKYSCARAKIVITYPRVSSSFDDLTIVTPHATFEYKAKERLLNIERMMVYLGKGSINVGGSVSDYADLKTGTGDIGGWLLSQGVVKATVRSGTINLDIDSEAPQKLDVSAWSYFGGSEVRLRQLFEGHFSLTSVFGHTELSVTKDGDTKVHYATDGSHRQAGWMSLSESEPEAMLPRIEMFSFMGSANLTAP
ncbi:hypothetical protein DFQ26_001873 [Actinomortierella ambigua]|nr:hypothetical protein DFQ26_001873 [Actinomortierella ambigua]